MSAHTGPETAIADKWKAYTGMAAAFLAVNHAEAQVIYTDVNPDLVLINGNYAADLDGDGTPDLNFMHITTNVTTSSGSFTLSEATVTGEFIGMGSTSYLYPNALVAGVQIGNSNSNWGSTGALGFLGARVVSSTSTATYGYWPGQTAYLGCRFTNGGGLHYGWVQLAVDPVVGSMTIMGYAYETVPGLAIVAGNQGGPSAVADLEGPSRLEVFPNPVKDLTTVRFGEALQGQITVQVLDGIGRILQEHTTTVSAERSMTLDLSDLPSGTYFVAVRSGERVIHRAVSKVK